MAASNVNIASVCSDKLENCSQFGKTSCRAPYEEWARDNCALYCGFCRGPPTTPVPCVDKQTNCQDYGENVCSDPKYSAWVLDNCRYSCRQCSSEQLAIADSKTTTPPPPPCVDTLENCDRYPRSVCSDPKYAPWANANCRYYCRQCTQEQLNIADSKTTTTTTEPTTVTTTGPPTTPPPCIDKVNACENYGKEVCNNPDYAPWVLDNCRYFCRKCLPDQLVIADSKTTTTPRPPCEDRINNCERYPKSVCSDPKYASWATDNCRYYCRKCTQEELIIADSKTTTTTTTPKPCVDKLPNCKRYSTDSCTNYRSWAEVNCPAYCQFCTPSGFVTIPTEPGFIAIPISALDVIRAAPVRKPVSHVNSELVSAIF
ncbi:uncharacterized protein LOC125659539 isoform X2 [Ostrea edulis]|uniref:uncharacterized protein LOC125659539 isoform X2 n=1 Tax=Ostrea edulis TaxID=37623 RepID=UPI0024AF0696|nr:uncharacterized protein LOC125659539 isoform X2 [Ostrea edulis]